MPSMSPREAFSTKHFFSYISEILKWHCAFFFSPPSSQLACFLRVRCESEFIQLCSFSSRLLVIVSDLNVESCVIYSDIDIGRWNVINDPQDVVIKLLISLPSPLEHYLLIIAHHSGYLEISTRNTFPATDEYAISNSNNISLISYQLFLFEELMLASSIKNLSETQRCPAAIDLRLQCELITILSSPGTLFDVRN